MSIFENIIGQYPDDIMGEILRKTVGGIEAWQGIFVLTDRYGKE